MAIYLSSLGGSVSIGVYSLATDHVVMIPKWIPLKKAEKMAEWLKVKLVHVTIGSSVLIGALACANSNGILLPSYVRQEELETLQAIFKGNITIMETKRKPNLFGKTLKTIDATPILGNMPNCGS